MTDLATYLHNTVAAARAKRFSESDQLSLGEIIDRCEAIAANEYRLHDGTEPGVAFDFEYLHPTDIDSWRGSYDELALGFSEVGDPPPLSQFIDMLKGAVGKTFTGYKGGDYVMSRDTPVWVARYGNSGNTAVVEVVDEKWKVVLMTGYREY